MKTTFTLGDLTVHRIIEREGPFRPLSWMFPDVTPDQLAENRSWMCPTSLTEDGLLILCFQSYVVRTPHHTILIDSCIGNNKDLPTQPTWNMKNDENYARALAAHGLKVEDIDYVCCTHLHNDHVGWNTRQENGRWVPTFPNARYLFTKKEYDYWASENAKKRIGYFAESVLPVMEANRVDLVTNTHQISDHVRFLPTPGHTPDHIAVSIGRGRDDAVIVGDMIHTPLQTRYPDLCPFFEEDKAQSRATRRNVLDRYCDTATLCCTNHFPSPSMGRITRWGDNGFTCEMVED